MGWSIIAVPRPWSPLPWDVQAALLVFQWVARTWLSSCDLGQAWFSCGFSLCRWMAFIYFIFNWWLHCVLLCNIVLILYAGLEVIVLKDKEKMNTCFFNNRWKNSFYPLSLKIKLLQFFLTATNLLWGGRGGFQTSWVSLSTVLALTVKYYEKTASSVSSTCISLQPALALKP